MISFPSSTIMRVLKMTALMKALRVEDLQDYIVSDLSQL